jgi:ABC-type multidrug transport system fused ATPase/permease subunit
MRGRTVIAIARRLSIISKMDCVVVMEQDRIVEISSHNALLEGGGAHARMWGRKSGGFAEAAH